MNAIYRIHLQGRIDGRWTDWLDGLEIRPQDDGTTLLTGEIVDQAALHGVLARIRDLGIPLISITRIDKPETDVKGDVHI